MFNFDEKYIGEEIGKGQSSVVFAYGNNKNDVEWAVKCTVTSSIEEILREIQEMVLGFSCEHPNVLSVKGFYIKVEEDKNGGDDGDERDDSRWSIYQKIPRMHVSLGKHLMHRRNQQMPFSKEEIVKFFYGIASGVEYLHSKMIAHRDIKPENILLDHQGNVKVADFGAVTYMIDKASILAGDRVGTPGCMAPEVERGEQLMNKDLYKADMWSVGIVMLRLCLGVKHNVNNKDILAKLPEVGDSYGSDILELIKSLLQDDRNHRATAKALRQVLEDTYSDILESVRKQAIQPAYPIKSSPSFEERKHEVPQTVRQQSQEVRSNGEYEPIKQSREEDKQKRGLYEEYASFREELEALKKKVDRTHSEIFNFNVADTSHRLLIEPKDPDLVTDDSFRGLIENLKGNRDGNTLKNIESLSLALRYCNKLSNRVIQQAVTDISKCCNNLHVLDLDFWGCNNIDDVLVRDISKQISTHLTKLESIGFFFNECHRITGAGLMAINRFIFNTLQNLKTVKLNFNNCHAISNDSVKDLVKQIGRTLKNLESIQLYFDECYEVADEAVTELAFQISSNLKGISTLVLVLSNCVMITESSVIKLSENIKNHMTNLKRLELGLYGITISSETSKSIKALVNHIPSCQIHF